MNNQRAALALGIILWLVSLMTATVQVAEEAA